MAENNPRTVKEALAEFRPLVAPGGATETPIDKSALEKRLQAVEKHCNTEHNIWLAILFVAFVGIILIVLLFIETPKEAAALITASGLGVGGIMSRLREVEREIARSRLLIALVSSLNESNISAVVTILAGKL
jgi:hypothetical protein